MALSTLFTDSKVASQIGSLILIAPMALFMFLFSVVVKTNDVRYMYCGYMVPFVPTMVILADILNVEPYNQLNIPATWAALIFSVPLYYGLYIYLD